MNMAYRFVCIKKIVLGLLMLVVAKSSATTRYGSAEINQLHIALILNNSAKTAEIKVTVPTQKWVAFTLGETFSENVIWVNKFGNSKAVIIHQAETPKPIKLLNKIHVTKMTVYVLTPLNCLLKH